MQESFHLNGMWAIFDQFCDACAISTCNGVGVEDFSRTVCIVKYPRSEEIKFLFKGLRMGVIQFLRETQI
ncbi:hypothetical protein BDDG_12721 [Blastomyces dermatitidis ATCC 18188]|uniref:Uncharacterized protein n=1 Tax=Ajellomyces dermatitidis (strain ATCC 18188 / CBS 674.68) TaxID=653446 RepID=A0A0J9EPT2_AJEDA|nr:hypothetical protein BDFG_02986 [Blastomyces dermatitidis ATCC 26199]KMW68298.1 hypothetical protein BDDG_12721 [Blastomyces dermatitidis ATCC 18188]